MELNGKNIVVWFSCGAASAIAAKLTLDKYGENNIVRIVNTPIDEEPEDNQRFLKDVEAWLGVKIETAMNSKYDHNSAEKIWEKRKYMAGVAGAPCTQELKKGARYEFERKNEIDFHVLGFTADEEHRHENFVTRERANVIPVLIDEGLRKNDCFWILNDAGVKLPESYKHFKNANCIGCVKANGVTYWQKVREVYPEVFQRRAELSRLIGARLVKYKGERYFLDEMQPHWKGGRMEIWECGLFCNQD
jgi:peroxiredoxin